MQIFIDSANLEDIEAGLRRGFAAGVTTNPSLLAKEKNFSAEERAKFDQHIGRIVELLKQHNPTLHLSVEVFSSQPDEILRQAHDFMERFSYPHLSIKIPIGWDELEVISRLNREGVSVNCTACMTAPQALMAAQAGAKYVSLFWGRIRDGGKDEKFSGQRARYLQEGIVATEDFDPAKVMRETRALIDAGSLSAKIIAGSMRSVLDVKEAALSGAHIVTVGPKFFKPMVTHYKTTEVIDQFLEDFQKWIQ